MAGLVPAIPFRSEGRAALSEIAGTSPAISLRVNVIETCFERAHVAVQMDRRLSRKVANYR
jgi:hypothetical protein